MDARVQTIEKGGQPGESEFGRYESVDASILRMASSILHAFGRVEAEAWLEAERRAQLGLVDPAPSQQNAVSLPSNVVPKPNIEGTQADYSLVG